METMQQMRERRNELAREARNIHDVNKGDAWKPEEHGKKFNELTAEIERIDAAISREQKMLDISAVNTFKDMGGRVAQEGIDDEKAYHNAIDQKWLRGGYDALTAEEMAFKNTMSTTTPNQGGYTVQSDVAATIIEAMKSYGGMRQVATILTTEKGNPLSYPTTDYTGQEGEIVTQNNPASTLDPSFGTKPLNVFKYGSKTITVPIELLQDSEVDLESLIGRIIVSRIGRITNKHFTVGTGTTMPDGIAYAATVGYASFTNDLQLNDLYELEHSVDPAYREGGRAGWMFNDNTLKEVRQFVDGNYRPIFLPSYDAGIRGGVPAELLGHPITINQDVADVGAGNKAVLFGDMSHYYIRDAMGLELFRFTDSPFTSKGQVGFLAWMRTGGNLMDVGGAVKALSVGTGTT